MRASVRCLLVARIAQSHPDSLWDANGSSNGRERWGRKRSSVGRLTEARGRFPRERYYGSESLRTTLHLQVFATAGDGH